MPQSHEPACTCLHCWLRQAHTAPGQCFPDSVFLQVKGAASDVADKSGAGDVADKAKGALENVKPKRGLFERINDEALTKNAPSVQQQSKSS